MADTKIDEIAEVIRNAYDTDTAGLVVYRNNSDGSMTKIDINFEFLSDGNYKWDMVCKSLT